MRNALNGSVDTVFGVVGGLTTVSIVAVAFPLVLALDQQTRLEFIRGLQNRPFVKLAYERLLEAGWAMKHRSDMAVDDVRALWECLTD